MARLNSWTLGVVRFARHCVKSILQGRRSRPARLAMINTPRVPTTNSPLAWATSRAPRSSTSNPAPISSARPMAARSPRPSPAASAIGTAGHTRKLPEVTAACMRTVSACCGLARHSSSTCRGTCTSANKLGSRARRSSRPNEISGPASLTTTLVLEGCKLAPQLARLQANGGNAAPAQFVDHLAVAHASNARGQTQADLIAVI